MTPGFAPSRNGNDYSWYCYRMYERMYEWFHRNKSLLLALNIISIMALFLIHFFILSVQINPSSIAEKILQTVTIGLISIIALSIIWRGIICIAIGTLGLSLIYAGILLPSYILGILEEEESYLDGKNEIGMPPTIDQQPISVAAQGFFFLGIAMVGLCMIIGYRPDVLYVRNRPEPSDTIWENYPIWYDYNVKFIGRYSQPIVHIKSLMTDEESYLLWRYEYILADVLGTPHLVKPDSYVPKRSIIFRDKESGKMIGKAKYVGYFV